MEELDERGGPVAPLGHAARQLGREEHERRPDLLPLPPEEVLHHGVEEPDARAHRVAEVPPEHGQVLGDRGLDLAEPDRRRLGQARGARDGGRGGEGRVHAGELSVGSERYARSPGRLHARLAEDHRQRPA